VVIPAVERSHPRNRAHRAIAGFSMGGYGAMNLALRHRNLFRQVVSIAGYFHVDDPSRMFAGNARLIAANSPDRHVAAARGLRIMLTDGSRDGQRVVAGESQRFAALLRAAHIPVTLSLPDGGHTWAFVASQFSAVEGFLEQGWGG
jgi:S-formylglutathione hydrolase FrmB